MRLVAKTSKEYSETIQAVAQAIKDGTITKAEAEQCLKETRDLMIACMELGAHLEHLMENDHE